MAISVDIDAAIVDALVRRGFLDRQGEAYRRDEIRTAVQQALRVLADYE